MSLFAVVRRHGPDWDRSRPLREQAGWDAHAAFMDALTEEGFVVLGGPLGGEEALLIVRAADEAEVEARLAEDPWPATMLAPAWIEPWEILLGGL